MKWAVSTTIHAILIAAHLPGCLDDGHGVGTDPQLPGLALTGMIEGPPSMMQVNVQVDNTGTKTYTYPKGCFHEWRISIIDAEGGESYPFPPLRDCHDFEEAPIPPKQIVVFGFTWNGKLYEAEDEQPEDGTQAPPGRYSWDVGFHLGMGKHQEPSLSLRIPFQV